MPQSKLLTLAKAGPIQMGFWVPNRVWATAKFLVPLRDSIAAKKKAGTLAALQPEIQELKAWVTTHSVYRMWVTAMIDQANAFVQTLDEETREEIKDQDGDVLWIDGFDSLFEILNEIITTSPSFNTTAMVGTPMNGLLAIAMATEAGLALFHDTTFNHHFKRVLDAWNRFLKSGGSLDKLDIYDPEKEGSWISKAAWKAGVWDQMEHDSHQQGYGFDSWNSFFIRNFVSDARPFQGPPEVVDIGCETTPWQYANDIALETEFWVKEVNYSLLDIFGGQEQWARLFEGGQLYQGFLSATHYHRWNAPLDGTIVRSWLQPGTYFAQRPEQGENPGTWEGTESQPYLGHVAARAIFIFKHQQCGYVALICIGMVEVSTCVIEPGYVVGEGCDPKGITRGREIGHFEFGGSTHMLVFQRDKVRLADWAINAVQHREDDNPTPMGSIIAWPL
jgi:phosphatidylserine decarboxylase